MATFISYIHPSKRAAITVPGGPRLSYAQLADLTGHLQTLFNNQSSPLYKELPPQANIAISLQNNLEFVVTFLGVTNGGRVAAPLNPNYTKNEVDFYLDDLNARAIVIGKIGQDGKDYSAVLASAIERGVYIVETWFNASRFTVDYRVSNPKTKEVLFSSSELPVFKNKDTRFPGIAKPEDVALILHTSGTTGRPKSVPLTHANISRSMLNISNTYQLTPNDKTYVVMPLFHVHGLIGALLSTLSTQGEAIIPIKFSARVFWDEFINYKATWYSAVPTIHSILLHTKLPAKLPNIRFIRSCSSALAPATFERLEATFKAPVVEAYAMTEASHQMCSNFLPSLGKRKPGTVGKGQGVEVVILDDNNNVLEQGEIGEVSIKGSNVTKGYSNNPKANAEAFTNGYFRTGDQGFFDEDGFLNLTGRLKELINRGGEKISPIELDGVLLKNDAVKEAVAFGAEDAKYGQVVHAAVVLSEGHQNTTQEELQKYLKGKISDFKIPEKFFFVDALPKTATGKIQRRNIAKIFAGKTKL